MTRGVRIAGLVGPAGTGCPRDPVPAIS